MKKAWSISAESHHLCRIAADMSKMHAIHLGPSIIRKIASFLKPQLVAAGCVGHGEESRQIQVLTQGGGGIVPGLLHSQTSKIYIVNAESGAIVTNLCDSVDEASLLSLKWSPCGRTLAAGFLDSYVRIFNAESGSFVTAVKLEDDPRAAEVESVGSDGTSSCVSEDEAWRRQHNAHTQERLPIAYSPCGCYIAAGLGDVYILDARKGAMDHILRDPALDEGTPQIDSIAWTPCGLQLAIAYGWNFNGFVSLWCLGQPAPNFMIPVSIPTSVAYSPSGQLLAVGRREVRPGEIKGGLEVYSSGCGGLVVNANSLSRVGGTTRYRVDCVAYEPDGQNLAVGGSDGVVCIYDPVSLRILQTMHLDPCARKGIVMTDVTSIAYTSCGAYLMAGCRNGYLYVLSAVSRGQIEMSRQLVRGGLGIMSVACAPSWFSAAQVCSRHSEVNQKSDEGRADTDATFTIPVVDEAIVHMESAAIIPSAEAAIIEDLQMAGRVERMLGCSPAFPEAEEEQHMEQISICTLNRRPKGLKTALQKALAPYIEALRSEDYDWIRSDGSLVIVHPHQFTSTRQVLRGRKMWPSNLVVAESLEYLVDEALATIRGGSWAKARHPIDISTSTISKSDMATVGDSDVSSDNLETEGGYILVEKRTFLAYVRASSAASSIAQSSSDGHILGWANPRQKIPGGIVAL